MSKITLDQFAVMSVQYVQYSFDYYVNSMKQCELKHIDLWGGIPHYCRLDYPFSADAQEKIDSMNRKIKENGLDVVVYTPETLSYPYSFTDPDEEVRKRTIDYFSMAMDDAKRFGTDKVFLNSGCGLRDLPRNESWERLIDTYKKIARIAEEKEIKLVLEQLQPYESNLVTRLEDIARVLKEVGSDALFVCVDVVAMAVAGESLRDYFEAFGSERIQLIHFADTCHYILGTGELPLKEYIKIMEEYDYKGVVDLEINDSIYWEDPHASIAQSVEWLKKVLY